MVTNPTGSNVVLYQSVGFPNITQDVIYEHTAAHPAFLSLPHHITLMGKHTNKPEQIPTQRMN